MDAVPLASVRARQPTGKTASLRIDGRSTAGRPVTLSEPRPAVRLEGEPPCAVPVHLLPARLPARCTSQRATRAWIMSPWLVAVFLERISKRATFCTAFGEWCWW
jgi:hypothetical protein